MSRTREALDPGAAVEPGVTVEPGLGEGLGIGERGVVATATLQPLLGIGLHSDIHVP